MDSLRNMNKALAYIEEHLDGDVNLKEAAKYALCSEYHFQRMFSYLSGFTLTEYIRRRRLTCAAAELRDRDLRVIDAALKYGYQSPDAFTRAFKEYHGITPTEARDNGSPLKAFPKMTFQLTIDGGEEMNYRIEEKQPFSIAGIMKRVPIVFKGVNTEIEKMWKGLNGDLIQEMKQLSNTDPSGIVSASVNFSEGRMEEKGELDHYIGAATTRECPAHLASLKVPASTWAVFEVEGPFPDTLQNVWGRIYSEWFPSAPFEQAEGPEILWNEQKDITAPDFKSEIWIPVSKKK
ncbi:AraC family transcriptional regulator [Bacillus salacetis]|uniref:AraC family transcriptional regulator n=1 Tax=Bacillus salacetis TaxID=2315464 RepID=A0A3A1QMJ1_9BACI|nr:AraC family transcriptional regulator [Bacillus salacetis]RIW28039.1 AraC family transcriptional regulator [Bacillus salacetis]